MLLRLRDRAPAVLASGMTRACGAVTPTASSAIAAVSAARAIPDRFTIPSFDVADPIPT